jgi:hypothetical protein
VAGGAAGGFAGGGRPLLDVGFENLSMSLKSCGKQVLQGITGRLLKEAAAVHCKRVCG